MPILSSSSSSPLLSSPRVRSVTGLSRKHGVKVGAGFVLSVEEVWRLAVGQEIGHSSVKSATRMNRAVVLFLKVEQVNMLVETGITVGGQFVQVTLLTQPAARITLSNVPPFISDEFLVRELSRPGKVFSPFRKMLSGCKSPLLRHVVSHRRQVHMILNNRAEEFNYRFIVRVDDFDYTLFATSSTLKCFICGEEGHLARACASHADPDAPAVGPAAPEPRPVPAARRRWFGAEGGPVVPDGAVAESHMEEKQSECMSETEVSGGSENVEMVEEMNGESGEAGGKVDLTGVVCDLSGVMSDVVCDSNELGKHGEVMAKTVELGEAGETGDLIQTVPTDPLILLFTMSLDTAPNFHAILYSCQPRQSYNINHNSYAAVVLLTCLNDLHP
ncbi:Transposon TX1 uncharacterized 82 kDa protein ORF 1 [Takifugu flavidus]|uniref:Transposon TX1 uncharacterized 82 kDa protein ORF 1 n=1 Tax=Takifugu flavidus TaxID=433684 RepID=A0A5C6PQQ3_9TELE|nr:Transposon TX1 uncharacterized 82 kDa protein ORF 1 [Takifugu flavidus]